MKKVSTKILCVVLVMVTFFSALTPASATTSGVQMYGGVDYSGRGTRIVGEIADGNEATVSGNYVNIPVYRGKYVPGAANYWFTKSWSGWSTSNNKKNEDFTVYNGTSTATEYDVQSRTEYRYKRVVKEAVYSKKYYTVYRGTKWYNFWITFTKSKWNGYYGAVSGYKIVNRYTRTEKSGTKDVTQYSSWRTNAPFAWSWESQWKSYTSRTTYRYRSRTLKWDDAAVVGMEQVPLNYSLYDQKGDPLYLGIKYEVNRSISQKDNRSFAQKMFLPVKIENCYSVTQYYVHIDALEKQIHSTLTDSANSSDPIIEEIISNLSKGTWFAIGQVLKKYGKQAVFKSLGKCVVYVQIALTAADAIMQQMKKDSIADFNDVMKSIDDDDKVLLIQKTIYQDLNSPDGSWPVTDVELIILEDTPQYISAKYDSNRANKYGLYNYSNQNYYGEVSYIKSHLDVTNVINSYLNSFDIFSWASFIPS